MTTGGASVQFPSEGAERSCSRCHSRLHAGALACDRCHALVHGQTLEQTAAQARLLEGRGELAGAHEQWLRALELLPENSTQAQWIRGDIERISALSLAATAAKKDGSWLRKTGPFAPLLALLVKGKFLLGLLKFKFLLSLGVFIAFYWGLYGVWFGLGFALLILVHEMGHFIEIKRRGLPADMPIFLPGIGAYVRWTALGVSVQTRSLISLAGPLAGLIGAAVCVLLWMRTGAALWIGLASLSAILNVLNLIPVWVLDGGQAIAALNRDERIIVAVAAVLCAAFFGQPLFLLVAAGAAYRLFTKDFPATSSHAITAYYVLVLVGLGLVIAQAPIPQSAG